MAQAQVAAPKSEVIEAAIRAVYQLQYNTQKACSFIAAEVPNTAPEVALAALQQVVKVQKRK